MKTLLAHWRAIVAICSIVLGVTAAFLDAVEVTAFAGAIFFITITISIPQVWDIIEPYWSHWRWAIFPGLEITDAGLGLLKKQNEPIVVSGFSITIVNRTRRPIVTLDGHATLLPAGETLQLFAAVRNKDPRPLSEPVQIAVGQTCYIDFRYGRGTEFGVDWGAFSTSVDTIRILLVANGKFETFQIPKHIMHDQLRRFETAD